MEKVAPARKSLSAQAHFRPGILPALGFSDAVAQVREDQRRRVIHHFLERGRIEGPADDVLPDGCPAAPIAEKHLGVNLLQSPGVETRSVQHCFCLVLIGDDTEPAHPREAVRQLIAERVVDAIDINRPDASEFPRIGRGRSSRAGE